MKASFIVLCWSAVASAQCQGDTRMLSDAFTSTDVYKSKSPAPSKHPSAAVSTGCLNDHDSEKTLSFLVSGKVMLTYTHKELSDLGKKTVIV